MCASLEKRMSACETTVVWTYLCRWFLDLCSVGPLNAGITLDHVTVYLKLHLWNFIYLFARLYWALLYDTYFFL
jgi:hypothetical protein